MSPIRSPSPFENSNPGDALLSSSINLEDVAVSAAGAGPVITSKLSKGEIIMLKTEHLYPNAVNGKPRCRTIADLLKRLASVGVSAVVGGVRALAETSLPAEDENSAVPEEGGGTLSMILSTKKAAIFDEALAGVDTLSKGVYIKAFIDPETEGSSASVDEVIRRVEEAGLLPWDGESGDVGEAVHDYAATGRGLGTGFVLINLSNDLGGEGQGYLQMLEELDGNDHGDIDVCYSGSRF